MLHVSIDKNKNNPNNICCDWDVLCETGTSPWVYCEQVLYVHPS